MTSSNIVIGEASNTQPGNEAYQVTIPITWKPLFSRLIFPKETSRTFTIGISKISTLRVISALAKGLPDKLVGETTTELALKDSYKNQGIVLEIVGASIQNNGKRASARLVKFLERNLNPEMLKKMVAISIRQLRLEAFLNSLILIKGTASILQIPDDVEPGKQVLASQNDDHAEG